jgi:SAM-dependent methyltransferase
LTANLSAPARPSGTRMSARIAAERRRADARENERFDHSVGIDAMGKTFPRDMTIAEGGAAVGHLYVGEPIRVTRWWLGELPPRLDGFTFVDIGSGKGRPLFAAAEAGKGFRRIVGVEYGRELHEDALANIAGYSGTSGAEIEAVCADARAYEFPLDPLVIHFANPFMEDVMAEVIANIVASYEQRPRPIFAVYYQQWNEPHPTANAELLAAAPLFARHRTLKPSGVAGRVLLSAHRLDMFATAEAAQIGSH